MTALPLAQIRCDADCQSRARLDEETVAEYAHRIKEGPDVRGAYGLHGREMIAWLARR